MKTGLLATVAAAILDAHLHRLAEIVDNICFYKAIHDMLCPRERFQAILEQTILQPHTKKNNNFHANTFTYLHTVLLGEQVGMAERIRVD